MVSDFKKVFAKNLSRLLSEHNKTQADLVNDLNLNKSTVSTWINATKMPRMNKVEQLAAYFGVEKSDLIEEKSTTGYYVDPEAAEFAEYLRTRPGARMLFSAAKDITKEEMEETVKYIDLLKRARNKNND